MSLDFETVRKLELEWLDACEDEEPPELVEALFDRYPFLVPRTRWSDEVIAPNEEGRSWTELVAMPWGWRRALGILLVEDVRTILVAGGGEEALTTYRIDQVKEKYGELRWYIHGPVRFGGFASDYLGYITELYCSICGFTCIECGSMRNVRQTQGWIVPICEREDGYAQACDLPDLKCDEDFCVWVEHSLEGAETRRSYKDLLVGEDAPVVKDLGLESPLHVSEVWARLCNEQRNQEGARP